MGSFEEGFAFDGARKGFILGGGVGAGFLSHEMIFQSRSDTENAAVFLTEFKIGGAPSNSLEVYFISKGAHLADEEITLNAAGVTKYLGKTGTGVFLTGGVGLTTIETSDEGFGLFGGIGFEFAKHFTVETNILYSRVDEASTDSESFSFRVTVNGLAF